MAAQTHAESGQDQRPAGGHHRQAGGAPCRKKSRKAWFNSAIKLQGHGMELHRRRGAPDGNKNRLKHGRYSAAALTRRKLMRETLRSARLALMQAKFELARCRRNCATMRQQE